MLSELKKGDKVVTIGGIHGTIASIDGTDVVVKVDDNTKIKFLRSAISNVVNAKETKDEKADKDEKAGKSGRTRKIEDKKDDKNDKIETPVQAEENVEAKNA
jgi:preprotein translocase subunit YajC